MMSRLSHNLSEDCEHVIHFLWFCRTFGFIRKCKVTDAARLDGRMLRDVVTSDNREFEQTIASATAWLFNGSAQLFTRRIAKA